ncbi:MAG: flagellar biosynthesis protein FlhB [Eubacterium sp.]|nr:flagellar biosynthesis protein FlhB [Eubacterium sp.]
MANDDKTEKPTAKRLREAREEGNVFQSRDIVTVLVLLAGTILLRARISSIRQVIRQFLLDVLQLIQGDPAKAISGHLAVSFIRAAAVTALPVALVIAVIEIVGGGVQTRFNFSKKALQPKFSRMNPLNGFKRLFSLRGVMELLKNLAKVVILVLFVFVTLKSDVYTIAQMIDVSVPGSEILMFRMLFGLLFRIILAFAAIAAVDWAFQKWQHSRDLMMTKQEVKDEFKQEEGNPEIKGRIKKKQREIAQRRMMQQVPQADVVVRNPTHVAVALKYDPERSAAPIVLAKGLDAVALRIIRVAEQNHIPWVENKELARGLYASCELNMEIPAEYYSAVAELLVYIYKQENRADIFDK